MRQQYQREALKRVEEKEDTDTKTLELQKELGSLKEKVSMETELVRDALNEDNKVYSEQAKRKVIVGAVHEVDIHPL